MSSFSREILICINNPRLTLLHQLWMPYAIVWDENGRVFTIGSVCHKGVTVTIYRNIGILQYRTKLYRIVI